MNALLRETGHQVTLEEATRLQRLHAEAYTWSVTQVRALHTRRWTITYVRIRTHRASGVGRPTTRL